MALQALSKIYSWEAAGKRSPNESRQQQLDRKLALRQQHCAPLMDCVDRIMETLAEKYAVKNDGKWQLARQGSAIGKAVIFWLNNSKELRTFLSDPRVSPDNNGVERAVRAATVYRNAAFFKQSVEGTRAYCNLLTLRETAKLNGIRDVADWLRAVHRAFYEYVERTVWTARYERLRSGDPLRLYLQSIPAEVIKSFDWEPWMPWNYVKTLAADERCTPI